MSLMTVFRIRNGKGLWSNGGYSASFTSKGKVWNTRGSMNVHISQISRHGYGSNAKIKIKLMPDDWEIFEITVDDADVNGQYPARVKTYKVNDVIQASIRKGELTEKYGTAFADLVERIEKTGDQDSYQWALTVKSSWSDKKGLESLQAAIKSCKLKRNTDYRASFANHGGAVAFKNKNDAMRVRLACDAETLQGVDIVNYLEFDN